MNEGMECCVLQTTPKPNPSATIHARCWTSTDHLACGIAAAKQSAAKQSEKAPQMILRSSEYDSKVAPTMPPKTVCLLRKASNFTHHKTQSNYHFERSNYHFVCSGVMAGHGRGHGRPWPAMMIAI